MSKGGVGLLGYDFSVRAAMISIGLSVAAGFVRENKGYKLSARLGTCQWFGSTLKDK
jgi:hypothetical protein